MKQKVTSKGKRAAKAFEGAMGQERMIELYADVFRRGKAALDGVFSEVGQLLVESIMYMEREEIAGPDYEPRDPRIAKGGTQPGSVYIGDRKLRVRHPRLRGPEGEIALGTYQQMKKRGAFSEELLAKSLRGLAGRRHDETIADAAESFGVARSTRSRRQKRTARLCCSRETSIAGRALPFPNRPRRSRSSPQRNKRPMIDSWPKAEPTSGSSQ